MKSAAKISPGSCLAPIFPPSTLQPPLRQTRRGAGGRQLQCGANGIPEVRTRLGWAGLASVVLVVSAHQPSPVFVPALCMPPLLALQLGADTEAVGQ